MKKPEQKSCHCPRPMMHDQTGHGLWIDTKFFYFTTAILSKRDDWREKAVCRLGQLKKEVSHCRLKGEQLGRWHYSGMRYL